MHSAVLRSHVVCLSLCLCVTLVDHDHIGWKSWKLIARTISPTSSLFIAQTSSPYSQGNMRKFWARKCLFNTYVNNDRLNWVQFNRESRDLRWRCGCFFTGSSFTFVGASRGHLCDCTAFLFHLDVCTGLDLFHCHMTHAWRIHTRTLCLIYRTIVWYIMAA